jgi:peptide/nickel transport system substrate-binding protein
VTPIIILVFLLSACHAPSDNAQMTKTVPVMDVSSTEVSPTIAVTNEPLEITVCTANLPESLFLYDGVQSISKKNILALLLDSPFDRVDGELLPVILEKIPTQVDGDLRLETAAIQLGQTVVDVWGNLVVLSEGVTVRPSGCRDSDCAVLWDGEGTLEMDQMVLEFDLRDDLAWSDGTALRASDSVFSFELAGATKADGLKWAEERTAVYEAVDEDTVRWIGKPGFTTAEIDRFFWTPLPSHLFEGFETWDEFAEDARLVESLLSYGPFVIASRSDSSITFKPNPYYFQADEGLPLLDKITFKQIEGDGVEAWGHLKSRDCDLLDSSFVWENNLSLLDEIQEDGRFLVVEQPGKSWTQLVFGIKPASYDDFYNPSVGDRPDIFGDIRTRTAIAMSLDRAAMLEDAAGGMGVVWSSFISPSQSQLEEGSAIAYDPEASRELLYEVGWRDHDDNPDTPLQAGSVENVPVGSEFSIELLASSSGFHQALADIIRRSLMEIGIGVSVTSMPAENLYAAGSDSLLFGRRFDLAILSWQPMTTLDCGFYHTWGIPSEQNNWIGTNIAGFSSDDYDNACAESSLALPDEQTAALSEAERVFIDSLPAVPLLSKPTFYITKKTCCDEFMPEDILIMFNIIETTSVRENDP